MNYVWVLDTRIRRFWGQYPSSDMVSKQAGNLDHSRMRDDVRITIQMTVVMFVMVGVVVCLYPMIDPVFDALLGIPSPQRPFPWFWTIIALCPCLLLPTFAMVVTKFQLYREYRRYTDLNRRVEFK